MSTYTIKIDAPLEENKPLKQFSNEEVAQALESEINRFQAWFGTHGNQPLVKLERALLRTYLAWKLLYEDGCPALQD